MDDIKLAVFVGAGGNHTYMEDLQWYCGHRVEITSCLHHD